MSDSLMASLPATFKARKPVILLSQECCTSPKGAKHARLSCLHRIPVPGMLAPFHSRGCRTAEAISSVSSKTSVADW